MRPGLVWVGLFTILLIIYMTLRDSIGTLLTFLLQLAIVLAVLAGASWYRYSNSPKGGFFFSDNHDESVDENNQAVANDVENTAPGIKAAP